MTHKDFVLIAGVFANALKSTPDVDHAATIHVIASQMADALATTNPRFDRARFMAAADGTPTTGRDKVRS